MKVRIPKQTTETEEVELTFPHYTWWSGDDWDTYNRVLEDGTVHSINKTEWADEVSRYEFKIDKLDLTVPQNDLSYLRPSVPKAQQDFAAEFDKLLAEAIAAMTAAQSVRKRPTPTP